MSWWCLECDSGGSWALSIASLLWLLRGYLEYMNIDWLHCFYVAEHTRLASKCQGEYVLVLCLEAVMHALDSQPDKFHAHFEVLCLRRHGTANWLHHFSQARTRCAVISKSYQTHMCNRTLETLNQLGDDKLGSDDRLHNEVPLWNINVADFCKLGRKNFCNLEVKVMRL